MRTMFLASAFAMAITVTPAAAQETGSFKGLNVTVLGGYDSVQVSGGRGSGGGDLIYGLGIGYDVNLGSTVVGVEAEIADSKVRKSWRHILLTADRLNFSAARDIYAGVRVGVQMAPSLLAYAKGGYTNARIKATYDDDFSVAQSAENMSGFRLGAGLEYRFGRVGLRGEYRYSDYGHYSRGTVRSDISMQRHQVVLGVVGRF